MSEYNKNRNNNNRGSNGGGYRGGRGRGSNRGGERGVAKKQYEEKVEQPKIEVVTKKIEMNADDWKSMFAGQESENYEKQVKEEEEQKK